MILEQINGGVEVLLNGRSLVVGDSIDDTELSLVCVLGRGIATFRIDPSSSIDVKGAEIVVEEWLASNPTQEI
jgi:hypothetical protein